MKRTGTLAVLAALCALRAEAQVVRPLLSFPREFTSNVAIDDAGTAIYAVTSTNQFGTNPEYRKQIVRWDAATGVGAPVTDFEEGVESVSVSGDGSWLAFVSRADPLGTNHDESAELFVMHPDGTGLAQLTFENLLPLGQRGIRQAIISGSGNRIVFVGRVNLLGTNPTYTSALFVIDRDGTNLRQLQIDVSLAQEFAPNGYWPTPGLDISDDGSKIVYISGTLHTLRSISGINANGTGNHVFSSVTSPTDVVISGNGAKIVYTTGGLESHTIRARSFDGNPGTIVALGNGENASITDDATTVYHYRYTSAAYGPAGIYKMPSTGGSITPVSTGLQIMGLSGSGNLIAARGTELLAIDDTGGNLRQLTTTTLVPGGVSSHGLSPDGATLRFSGSPDPLGTNPGHEYEQFSFAVDTGQLTQLTDDSLPAIYEPQFTDAGEIVFASGADLTGQNPCGNLQIFRYVPGGAFAQLTVCSASIDWNEYPAVGDGDVIGFFSGYVNGGIEVFSMEGDGSGRTQLTTGLGNAYAPIAIGTASPAPLAYTGLKNGRFEIFRVNSDASGLQQVTSGSISDADPPTISGDGQRIAWTSRNNHTGQNGDGSFEAFLFNGPTGPIRQVTNTVGDLFGYAPRVTRNGSWVFVGDGRYNATTLALEPAAGFPHSAGQFFDLQPDATGNRWVVWLYDRLDNHPGASAYFLADMSALPSFTVGKASPTELSWDPSPTSLRYDVVRGSIANLAIAGSTVSLGDVSCLEDDSPDSHTHGYGDPSDPAPGEAFFFLYRGSVGANAVAGSYGHGTGAKERLPSSGGCNP